MKLSLPNNIRIEETWRMDKSSGFIDIKSDVPYGTYVDNFYGSSLSWSPYQSYCTSINLNPFFNFWALVKTKSPHTGQERDFHLVLFANESLFREWFNQIPESMKPLIIVHSEDKTGVK